MANEQPVSSREVRNLLEQLDVGIEQLRVAYEKYFMGVDRIAPQSLHDKIRRLLRECEAAHPRQTALRFRLNSLRARFVSYRHYWTRVQSQIENGTYRRHLQRLERTQRRDAALAAASQPVAAAAPAGDDLDAMLDAAIGLDPSPATPEETAKGTPPVAPPPKRKTMPPPPPAVVPGMDPRKVRALFRELVAAKKAAGEETRGLTYRGLCKQLARDAPKLRKQHGKITFVVARDGGRVRLKAKVGGSG